MPKFIAIKSAKLNSSIPINWQQQLAQAITDPVQLLKALNLDTGNTPHFSLTEQPFNLKTPLAYVRKMQANNPQDPLLLQVMTQAQEQPALRVITTTLWVT